MAVNVSTKDNLERTHKKAAQPKALDNVDEENKTEAEGTIMGHQHVLVYHSRK